MAKTEKLETADSSTEEKIKEAAAKVFTQKGFAATRTRDIAEEAGINLALLNYYFRSKEKLFDLVMMESLQKFLLGVRDILNDVNSSLTEKISQLASHYIDLLKVNTDLPLFILSEIRANPARLEANMGAKEILLQSNFYKQLEATTKKKVDPVHFLMNIFGLTVFPFVASPLLRIIGEKSKAEFDALMDERKKMIPIWIDAMLKSI
ncbi:DNA-binding transcriptional regulator, AcrR family [Pedobacter steynii]|uniref:DNA-binding transcriptional regulator, AcrR family n=1 Tax=Pedobacter steynii TaxID=430522 RepID=A0A1H0ACB6_9SPHI|nr:TetR family transcriptional regulator [Pedobacter steynii]NQX41406.1 TetR/AcrR family transcriptional regulator [Pedobacter steynii]SDN30944.1 DNA-binding transcriptional regulator, AcrR family [Pedobacter steynii]